MNDVEIIEIDGVRVRNIPEIPDYYPPIGDPDFAEYAQAKYVYKGFSICYWGPDSYCVRPSESNITNDISKFFKKKINAELEVHGILGNDKNTECMLSEGAHLSLLEVIKTIDKFWIEVMGTDPTGHPES